MYITRNSLQHVFEAAEVPRPQLLQAESNFERQQRPLHKFIEIKIQSKIKPFA